MPTDPLNQTFAALLSKHLRHGTRPKISSQLGRQWTAIEFGDATGVSDRQVRNWTNGSSRPAELETIELALFGRDQKDYQTDRLELRAAHGRFRQNAASKNDVPLFDSNLQNRVPLHFKGREAELEQLLDWYSNENGLATAITLHGMPGVGKSTLAAALANKCRSKYRAIWWVNSKSKASIVSDLASFGHRMGWLDNFEMNIRAIEHVLSMVFSSSDKILFIYDNGVDSNSIKPYLPRGENVDVLITSNSPFWNGVSQPILLTPWDATIGAEFLAARTGRSLQSPGSRELSKLLDGLPLAMEQAGAYCETLGASFDDYIKEFNSDPAKTLSDNEHATLDYKGGTSMWRTMEIATEEANRQSRYAKDLLFHISHFAEAQLPFCILGSVFAQLDKEKGIIEDVGGRRAVQALRSFALLSKLSVHDEYDYAHSEDVVEMHRLVRLFGVSCAASPLNLVHRRLMLATAEVFPADTYENTASWPMCRRLHPIAAPLVREPGILTPDAELARGKIANELGSYAHSAKADYDEAQEFFIVARDTAIAQNGEKHPSTALAYNNLGNIEFLTGDMVAAERDYTRSLEITDKVLGANDPVRATRLSNMAFLQLRRRNFEGALKYSKLALGIRWKNDRHDKDMAQSFNNIGFIFHEMGDYSRAVRFFKLAMPIYKISIGDEHPNANRCRRNYAVSLLALEKPNQAKEISIVAYNNHLKVLGEKHEWTVDSAKVLADSYEALGSYDQAEVIRQKFLID